MNDFTRDVRIGARGLLRTPTFTVAAIIILGFGIGMAVAMFTVFRAVLFERLPVRDPDRVVVLSTYKDPTVEAGLTLRVLKEINPDSLKVVTAYVEPSLRNAHADDKFQFERHGYFVADRKDHSAGEGKPVFNRVTGLKDSWGK